MRLGIGNREDLLDQYLIVLSRFHPSMVRIGKHFLDFPKSDQLLNTSTMVKKSCARLQNLSGGKHLHNGSTEPRFSLRFRTGSDVNVRNINRLRGILLPWGIKCPPCVLNNFAT